MTAAELLATWQSQLQELERLRAHVDGAVLCREVLEDFAAVACADDGALFSARLVRP